MSAPNDGGPAFPQTIAFNPNNEAVSAGMYFDGAGMTLRDWFAGQEIIEQDEHFELELCEALAGPRPTHSRKADPLAWEKWYATWRAEIRYLRADAMLRAREQKEVQP